MKQFLLESMIWICNACNTPKWTDYRKKPVSNEYISSIYSRKLIIINNSK